MTEFRTGNNVYSPRGSKYSEAIVAKVRTVNTDNEVKMAKLETWTKYAGFYDGPLLSFTDKLSWVPLSQSTRIKWILLIELRYM